MFVSRQPDSSCYVLAERGSNTESFLYLGSLCLCSSLLCSPTSPELLILPTLKVLDLLLTRSLLQMSSSPIISSLCFGPDIWLSRKINRTREADLLISFLLMLAMMCFDTMILVLGEGEMVGESSSDSGLVSCRPGDSVEMLLILRSPL